MFARLSPLVDGAPFGDASNGDLALAWIELQNSQGVVARRQRLNCPPFQLPNSTSSNSSNQHSAGQHAGKHRLLTVCSAGRNIRQTSKRMTSGQRLLRHQGILKVHANPLAAQGAHHQPSASHSSAAQPQTSSPQQQQQQQEQQQQEQQQSVSIDPQQLSACIQAASTFTQLQAICNTFLGHAAFTPQHAALVLSRLHLVRSRSTDSQLLLVELLAQALPLGCCSIQHQQQQDATGSFPQGSQASAQQQQQQQHQQQQQRRQQCCLSCGEVAAVCWAFSRAGYQPSPQLLQQLLQQFWLALGHQQQQQQQCTTTLSQQQPHPQQQQQVWPPRSPDEALATLIAGLAGLGCREAPCWQRMRAAVQVALSDSSASIPIHSLQQLAWGFAAVQQADAATVDALAAALRGRLGELETPEDLVQCVWSLHLMGCADRALFEQAAQLMVQRLRLTGTVSSSSSSSSSRSLMPTVPAAGAVGGASGQISKRGVGQVQQHGAAVLPQLPGAGTHHQQQQEQRTRGSLLLGQQAQLAPQQKQASAAAAGAKPQGLLSAAAGQTAVLCSAAASQAFGVLNKYDPLLCMLALYRDYYRPVHGV